MSGDPAGDEGVACYVFPRPYPNGYTEAPKATAADCRLEVTDTLRLEFGDRAMPARLLVRGPRGFSRVLREPELYIDLGSPVGAYRFVGTADGRDITGGFTVGLSTKRVVQLRAEGPAGAVTAHLALAGFAPSSKLTLYRYDQVKFEPTVGTGTRTWRRGAAIREVSLDERGEARIDLPSSVFLPKHNHLIVSDPMQDNSLNSARVMGEP